ncbi:hypothetical protein [Lacticaseibacillus paracasei]|uniref:Uncharacterized protein n=1 Tax=Lacticaseibacillus paracasei (strain ATCC 334 / BCRC 17002 / CCUG 31169 / CIP 107868 / KCTC 3260 / NRRL B-441) TaxID=321967 RepID=Q037B6_LACP3|nr:hypothetical protein [Lacticaseibacillus paracasei]ABD83398.1 hypothetical protein Lcas044 [Lacticaseibacillus paracasei ATCC 334]ABJ70706.1 hypothetical protein LSEI_1948 [Lacticaseibacillus paracasei ATCC 334]OSY81129.1 hypothetical protein BLW95_03600 [Lacticaseibacillus paracasei]
MANKIIRLESLSLMDHDEDPNDGGIFQTTRLIEVGHPYDEPYFKTVYDGSYRKLVERHSERDVVSIDFVRDPSDSDGNCYMVRLKDGNELFLPMHAFISESKEVTDDD